MSRIKEALSKTDNCWFSMLNDNVELLGVVIDNKLNFKSHISKLIREYSEKLMFLIDSITFFRVWE